ncbi:8198_t:CDS:2 [Funneliformis geosporum]|uniref:8198_t:CDS:1 n=1 Tax=Funneliformis geosporum TaxID=1117311 RepID=A0A9W4SJ57_9GLOM|nr:8198_t:CDS:2 [Funneliformis geosporum]
MPNNQHNSTKNKNIFKKGSKVKKKKTNINLFYLFKKFPLLSLTHYGFALFSAYGSTQLIFGYLGDALKKGGVETLKANVGGFLLRLIIYGITVYLHILLGVYLEEVYTAHLRKKLTKKFLSANFTQVQKEEFILSRFDNDAATVGRLAVGIFNRTLAILAILVPVLYYISYRYKLKRDREFEKENKRFKELKDNVEYVKTTGTENQEIKKSNQQFASNLRKNYAFVATKIMSGQVSGAILYAKLSTYGGYESYSSSCKRLNETFANLERNQISSPTINYLPIKKVDIAFQKVNFAYLETNKKILDNFSFSFQQGKKYVIIGSNGIGKSTLFKLMLKLYQPQKGVIELNNIELKKIDNSNLREKMVYLPNSPSFFNTSLGDNIVYPEVYQENIHQEKLEQIAQKLEIKEFIDGLPKR